MRPHRRQPTRLPCPWDSPGKNTGVGCHFLLQCMKVKSESEVAQSCLTLSDPVDCSLPGSSAHGIFQARVLEWVATAVSLKKAKWAIKKGFTFQVCTCNSLFYIIYICYILMTAGIFISTYLLLFFMCVCDSSWYGILFSVSCPQMVLLIFYFFAGSIKK